MDTKKWTKDEAAGFNDPYNTFFGGRVACGAAGDSDPFLFPIAGFALDGDDEAQPVMQRNMTFYDTKLGKWHWQKTSGEGPLGIGFFCAVGARGPDGTYEM